MKTTRTKPAPFYVWPHNWPIMDATHTVYDDDGHVVGYASRNTHPTSYTVYVYDSQTIRNVGRVPLVRDIAGRVAAEFKG